MALSAQWFTWMSSEVELLPGALDLILLRALEAMGPQHAYSLAARLEQVSTHRLTLDQGTLYPAIATRSTTASPRQARARSRRKLSGGDVWPDLSTLFCSTSRSDDYPATIPASSRQFLPTAPR